MLTAAATKPVRAEYHDNARRALEAGVFGSPFYVMNGEPFWGQDRLDMLEAAIIRNSSRNLG